MTTMVGSVAAIRQPWYGTGRVAETLYLVHKQEGEREGGRKGGKERGRKGGRKGDR